VLVAYGSTFGGTAEIGAVIGEGLEARDFDVDVLSAGLVDDVGVYDAVILGGSVRDGRWHRASRRFARRFAGDLTMRPVWLFSSGPLDWSADEAIVPPAPGAAKAMRLLDGLGHMTFGGSLPVGVGRRFSRTRRMARRASGDYRNFARIAAWADDVAIELATPALHLLAI
jgi:menaquinone-dependent protoporphyrinogen oxidase